MKLTFQHNPASGECDTKYGFAGVILSVLAIAGCATTLPVPVTGSTSASPRLKADTADFVIMYAKAKTNCPKVDSIVTELLQADPSAKSNSAGMLVEGKIEERWTAMLCAQEAKFRITFTPDGNGGTYFGVKPEQ